MVILTLSEVKNLSGIEGKSLGRCLVIQIISLLCKVFLFAYRPFLFHISFLKCLNMYLLIVVVIQQKTVREIHLTWVLCSKVSCQEKQRYAFTELFLYSYPSIHVPQIAQSKFYFQ